MKTEALAAQLLRRLKEQGRTLATAESCTGGGIGHVLTAIPGSSAVYLGGVISYTNGVKAGLLHVPKQILDTVGAVSPETAEAMVLGVRSAIGADVGISVTGLAGPDSDGSDKPVGLVYAAAGDGKTTLVRENIFPGDREDVRNQAIREALRLALELTN